MNVTINVWWLNRVLVIILAIVIYSVFVILSVTQYHADATISATKKRRVNAIIHVTLFLVVCLIVRVHVM